MSYSTIIAIYGVPITVDLERKRATILDDYGDIFDWEDLGFDTSYMGYPHWAGFCGVELDSFDVLNSYIPINKIKLSPTEEQKREALDLISKIDDRLYDALPEIGIYFIFTSS